jgi:hypothetical protein
MKKQKVRHYLPTLANTKAGLDKTGEGKDSSGNGPKRGCTDELIERLNRLGNTPPFCLRQRHRDHDML